MLFVEDELDVVVDYAEAELKDTNERSNLDQDRRRWSARARVARRTVALEGIGAGGCARARALSNSASMRRAAMSRAHAQQVVPLSMSQVHPWSVAVVSVRVSVCGRFQ